MNDDDHPTFHEIPPDDPIRAACCREFRRGDRYASTARVFDRPLDLSAPGHEGTPAKATVAALEEKDSIALGRCGDESGDRTLRRSRIVPLCLSRATRRWWTFRGRSRISWRGFKRLDLDRPQGDHPVRSAACPSRASP